MLKASLLFLFCALIGLLMGANGIAGINLSSGRLLLGIFLVLSLVTFVYGVTVRDRSH